MRENSENKTKNLEEKVALVKSLVKETYEALNNVEQQMDRMQKIRNALKRDLMDLKEGRLDRIEERHGIDKESAGYSIFTVVKKIVLGQSESNAWYVPFIVKFQNSSAMNKEINNLDITNSITKLNASGSYKLNNGEVKYL